MHSKIKQWQAHALGVSTAAAAGKIYEFETCVYLLKYIEAQLIKQKCVQVTENFEIESVRLTQR